MKKIMQFVASITLLLVGAAIPIAICTTAIIACGNDLVDQIMFASIMSLPLMPLSALCLTRARKAFRGA